MISVEVGEAVNDPSSSDGSDGPSFKTDTGETGNNKGTAGAGGPPLGIVAGAAGGGVALIAFIVIIALVIRKKNSSPAITSEPRKRTWSHTQNIGGGGQTGTELPERVGKFNKCESGPGQMHANPLTPATVEVANPFKGTPTGGAGGAGPVMSPILPQAMPAANKEVSTAWVECHDPATGRVYYANKTTGETQWTQPM